VNETNIKMLIEKVLQQVYNAPLLIEAVIDENLEVAANKLISEESSEPRASQTGKNQDKKDNLIDNLLKTFGGKIVDN